MDNNLYMSEQEFNKTNVELLEWFYLLGQIDASTRRIQKTIAYKQKPDDKFKLRLKEFKEQNIKK